MASQAELNRAKELLKINKELSTLRKGDVNVSFSATESLKELYGIRSRNSEAERESLKNARAVNDALLNQSKTYSSINELQREVVKNANVYNRSIQAQQSIENQLGTKRVDKVKELIDKQNTFLDQEKKITRLRAQRFGLRGKELEANKLESKILQGNLVKAQANFDSRVRFLTATEKELLFSKTATEELEKSNDLRETALSQVNTAAQFFQLLGTIPGVGVFATQ